MTRITNFRWTAVAVSCLRMEPSNTSMNDKTLAEDNIFQGKHTVQLRSKVTFARVLNAY